MERQTWLGGETGPSFGKLETRQHVIAQAWEAGPTLEELALADCDYTVVVRRDSTGAAVVLVPRQPE